VYKKDWPLAVKIKLGLPGKRAMIAVVGALREQACRLEPDAVMILVGYTAGSRGVKRQELPVIEELKNISLVNLRRCTPETYTFAPRPCYPHGALVHGILYLGFGYAGMCRKDITGT
jgi:hypothetical protein